MDNDVDQKVTPVSEYINDLTKVLPNEFENVSDSDFRAGIEKVINQEDFMSREELATEFAKTVTRNEEITPEVEVSALKTILAIDSWQKENRTKVRKYRTIDLENNFVKKTQEKNSGLTEDKLKLIREKVALVASVEGRVEIQKDLAFGSSEKSVGKVRNSWSDLKGVVGLLSMKPKEIDSLVSKNNKIDAGLEGVVLPYESFANLRSFDKIMRSDGVLNTIRSAPNQLSFINRGIIKYKQLTGRAQGIVQNKGPFVEKVGNQPVGYFVNRSMESLMHGDFNTGLKTIIGGLNTTGITINMSGLNMTGGTGSLLKNSFKDLFVNLGVGAKKFIENKSGKIGGVMVGGATAIVGVASTLFSTIGLAIANPYVLALLLVIFGINIINVNTMINTLVPRLEKAEGGGGGGGGPFNYGEITIENGRVISCGVGMEADFDRNVHKPMAPGSMSDDELLSFENQLSETVGDQAGTRCGVVYAAHYLAYDYKYWVPYWLGGRYKKKGINPKWGAQLLPTPDNPDRKGNGLDCGHFRDWAWVNGGFPGGRPGNTKVIRFGNCEEIKSQVEPGDGLFIDKKTEDGYSHSAIVLAYDDKYIKFAHSGSKSGVSTGLINICTGKGVDNGMTFETLQKKIYNNSDL